MHQAARIGRSDIHPGALADSLEPLEDLEVSGGVVSRDESVLLVRADRLGHDAAALSVQANPGGVAHGWGRGGR